MPYPATITPTSSMANSPRGQFRAEYNGALYLILIDAADVGIPGSHFHALKSTDSGLTWTAVDDGAAPLYAFNPPVNQAFGQVFTVTQDGASMILMWVNTTYTGGSPPNTITGLSMCVFDLATETWGSTTSLSNPGIDFQNTGGTSSNRVTLQLLTLSAGHYLLFYSGTQSANHARCSVSTFDGVTFGAEVQLPNQAGDSFFPVGGTVDSNGVQHLVYYDRVSAFFSAPMHVSRKVDGTFGTTQDLSSILTVESLYYGGTTGMDVISTPIVFGSPEMVGFLAPLNDGGGNEETAIFSGDASVDPTWTFGIVNNTSTQPPQPQLMAFDYHGPYTSLAVSGNTLLAAWNTGDGSSTASDNVGHVYTATSPVNSLSWSAPTLQWSYPNDSLTAKTQAIMVYAFGITGAIGIFGFGLSNTNFEPISEFSLVSVASSTASVTCSITIVSPAGITLAGSLPNFLVGRGGCPPRNTWDACSDRYARAIRYMKLPPNMFNLPAEYINNCSTPWDDDYGAIPPEAVPIRKTSGITTPAPAAGDQTVITFRCPPGYDGILTGFFFGYSGTGFSQGSGDLIYRIQINQRYVKDLSNVEFLIGSTKSPANMTQGQLLLSGQTVNLIVNVPNLSGLIQVGQSTVSGGLYGFLYPR